ncbi:FtsK/SpoIIIE domain-containing protein, partial [Streptomyces anulatus]|uniref:FtsK/SpoIIIE domain-containing protein n=1 Tax=Streptomyces anulatus TaxID=1892 RepID=UPI0033CE8DBC
MKKHKWVDPAPFEGYRPRVPWWAYLPWWLNLLLLPFVLAWLAVCLVVRLGLVAVHYPVSVVGLLTGHLFYVQFGWSGLAFVALSLTGALTIWAGLDRGSFLRRGWYRLLTEWRRLTVYVPHWRTVMRLADLTKESRRKEYLPKLRRVRSEGWRDKVRVRMIPAQSPEQWEARRDNLAHSFNARSCRVRVLRPSVLELDFIHSDPLSRPVTVPQLAQAGEVDLKRVVVGQTETGKPWRLKLLGSQVLVVGVPGAGKGSVLWSIVWQLAPAIKAGLVRLVGIDPKGGMELGQCPDAFEKVVYDNGPEAVALLEEIAAEVKERA